MNSSNEHLFNNAKPVYQAALTESGYDFELKFDPDANKSSPEKIGKEKSYILTPHFQKG